MEDVEKRLGEIRAKYEAQWGQIIDLDVEWLLAQVEGLRAETRRLEDACLLLWAELPIQPTKALRAECPALMDFLAHLHHSIEHEQAMTRQNVWTPAADEWTDEIVAIVREHESVRPPSGEAP